MKKLIINADDFGLSPQFNRGVLELIEQGRITSLTVMIEGKHLPLDDLKKLVADKKVSVGLHLVVAERDDFERIAEEQIRKFRKIIGRLPSHLDGHKHCHLGDNIEATIRLAKRFQLPVRSIDEKSRTRIKAAGFQTPDGYISWHPRREKKLYRRLAVTRGKMVELVCHPGYGDKNCDYPYNQQREAELKIMKSDKFAEAIKPFELINYHI